MSRNRRIDAASCDVAEPTRPVPRSPSSHAARGYVASAPTPRGADPVAAMLGSASGRSTTNSVRWAGKTCSLTSTGPPVGIGRGALAAQHRRPDRHLEQRGVARVGHRGADRLHRAAERLVDQLVEGRPLDVGAGQVGAEVLGAPHGDPGEGLAVGQVEPAHLQHRRRRRAAGGPAAAPARSRSRGCGARSARRTRPSCPSIVPSRPSDWRSGSTAANQPNPWRASTSPSSRSSSSALRIVTRLASYAADSSASLGSVRPAANSPASTRRRSSSAIAR